MRIQNSHAIIDVQPLAAAISNAVFRLPDGKEVSPLYRAPWRDSTDPRMDEIPALLRELGAEWPCVPFGMPGVRDDLPQDWQLADAGEDWNEHPHGYASNHDWQLSQVSESALRAEIDYPADHPIERLVRNLWLDPSQTTVHIALTVHARTPTRLPVGLHPVIDLAGFQPETCNLAIPPTTRAWTFPTDVEPGRSRFLPDQRNVDPTALVTADGTADVGVVPFPTATEDLVLLTGLDGSIGFVAPASAYRVDIDWDRSVLPNCLLWLSNGGREGFPWNGANRAIGIEPVAAPFDLGVGHSLSETTPFASHGISTAIPVSPDKPLSIDYRIDVAGL
ncbi:MAG: hypothetical protein AAFW76_06025 [Pseudomonadota bacterium]